MAGCVGLRQVPKWLWGALLFLSFGVAVARLEVVAYAIHFLSRERIVVQPSVATVKTHSVSGPPYTYFTSFVVENLTRHQVEVTKVSAACGYLSLRTTGNVIIPAGERQILKIEMKRRTPASVGSSMDVVFITSPPHVTTAKMAFIQ